MIVGILEKDKRFFLLKITEVTVKFSQEANETSLVPVLSEGNLVISNTDIEGENSSCEFYLESDQEPMSLPKEVVMHLFHLEKWKVLPEELV